MYECGKLKKVIGNKFLFPVILEQCGGYIPKLYMPEMRTQQPTLHYTPPQIRKAKK